MTPNAEADRFGLRDTAIVIGVATAAAIGAAPFAAWIVKESIIKELLKAIVSGGLISVATLAAEGSLQRQRARHGGESKQIADNTVSQPDSSTATPEVGAETRPDAGNQRKQGRFKKPRRTRIPDVTDARVEKIPRANGGPNVEDVVDANETKAPSPVDELRHKGLDDGLDYS